MKLGEEVDLFRKKLGVEVVEEEEVVDECREGVWLLVVCKMVL